MAIQIGTPGSVLSEKLVSAIQSKATRNKDLFTGKKIQKYFASFKLNEILDKETCECTNPHNIT